MILRTLDRLEETLIALFLGVMTVLTFVQVVLRYVFNSGFVWSLEATTYSFTWLVLLGMSYGVRTHSHITVDVLVRLVGPAARRWLALGVIAISLVYVGFMFWGGYSLVERLYSLGNYARDLPLPRWLLTSILPLGFALLGFRLLQLARDIYTGKADHIGARDDEASAGDEGEARDEPRDKPRDEEQT